jgi:Transposase, Mutator family
VTFCLLWPRASCNCRNGYRDRTLDTRLGSLNLKIPKLRAGSYFPPFLEARKTAEKALVAVIHAGQLTAVSSPIGPPKGWLCPVRRMKGTIADLSAALILITPTSSRARWTRCTGFLRKPASIMPGARRREAGMEDLRTLAETYVALTGQIEEVRRAMLACLTNGAGDAPYASPVKAGRA